MNTLHLTNTYIKLIHSEPLQWMIEGRSLQNMCRGIGIYYGCDPVWIENQFRLCLATPYLTLSSKYFFAGLNKGSCVHYRPSQAERWAFVKALWWWHSYMSNDLKTSHARYWSEDAIEKRTQENVPILEAHLKE